MNIDESFRVSVVIPTYNRLDSTKKAILSVVAQTVDVFEILVIDDGSDPKIADSLDHFVSSISYCKFIRLPHTGNPGLLRNIGIREATGDLIAFLDSDDEWRPLKTEIQLSAFYHFGASIVGETLTPTMTSGREASFTKKRTRQLISDNFLITSSVMLKREIAIKAGLFPEDYFALGVEDYILWLKVSTLVPIFLSDQSNTIYCQSTTDSLSNSLSWANILSREKALLYLMEFVREFFYIKTPLSRTVLRLLPQALLWDIQFKMNKRRSLPK